jgi:pimeloyl-ACP methyl ester carboxylesterase
VKVFVESVDAGAGSARRRRRTAVTIAVAAVSLLAGGLAGSPAQAVSAVAGTTTVLPSSGVVAPIPTLNWHECFDGALECARATVPLDYDEPAGATTSIFMSRHAATDPGHRIGTLFVNPGGPGGPSSQVTEFFTDLLGPQVAAHFDVIGIDPRGVGRSTRVTCRSSHPEPRFPRNWIPLDREQAMPLIRYNTWYANACAEDANAILDHMSTADTARDMDLIRQAVGDAQLSYYGISYGTYLGATYAAMFPDQVRALVLDGVLDPIAWSTGRPGWGDRLPFSTRLRSGVGAWDALVSAFAECDRVGKQRCPLAGEAGVKWQRIIKRLRHGPAEVSGGTIVYSDVIGGALGALYSRGSSRFLMREIKRLYRELFVTRHHRNAKADLVAAFRKLARSQPGPYAGGALAGSRSSAAKARPIHPTFEGVACADTINPTDPFAWVKAGAVADRMGPWFGRAWTWASGPCATWPGSSDDAFFGPWQVETSSPALLVGNFHDPATPISGARVLTTLLGGSRLLSLDTWGHGALGESACSTARMASYLVSGALPPEGLVCQPDKQLFPRRT